MCSLNIEKVGGIPNQMNQVEIVESEAMGALAQLNRAEIDVQIRTAKQYPRQISKVQNDVLSLATIDEETAGSCFFALPRGGKTITGPSVRMAEIVVSCYGNLRAAWRPVHVDRVNGIVTCQGMCHDLEKNVATTIEKTRQVQKRKGADHFNEDMITLAINACGAIAYRDAIYKVVPMALVKPLFKQIQEAARGKGTLDQRVERILKRLIEMGEADGIKQKDMEARILAVVGAGKRSDIDLTSLDVLIGMGTSVGDGEIRLKDAFPDPKVQHRPDAFESPAGSKSDASGSEESDSKPSGKSGAASDEAKRPEAQEKAKEELPVVEEPTKKEEPADTPVGGEDSEAEPPQDKKAQNAKPNSAKNPNSAARTLFDDDEKGGAS